MKSRPGAVAIASLALVWLAASPSSAQVQTAVPPVVAGATPVAVEHIQVHGAALEGNLEGDAVDRDVFVFLPPSYAKEKSRRSERLRIRRAAVWSATPWEVTALPVSA